MAQESTEMNLPRLRELAKAGQDGSIRPEELKELLEVLPEVIETLGKLLGRNFVSPKRSLTMCICGHSAWSHYAGSGKCETLLPSRCVCQKVQ
jgi:hypothetical protein